MPKLEKVLEKSRKRLEEKVEVKPIIDEAMHRVMGITMDELSRDISEKLRRSPIIDFDINTRVGLRKARKQFIRRYLQKLLEIKQSAVNAIIEDVLDNYKAVIHTVKLDEMYKNVSEFSKDIIEALPERQPTLKEAEEEFEKEFIRKALSENNGSITKTARNIGLRYETLHRKMKRFGL